ncbi:ankyrin repeat-containing domain protein [Elsinoe ampelina]|uniref:Ankyrin repeat-containing domain protein n=1 Tax=Elsinoe ampelina TaxID=302913 RepID=A0A6A6GH73_9PEZI|nr:ankyrin repeat-containing domain protein [Elsinoe ampelina]
MDPLSAGASVSQLIVTIASVAKFIHRIQRDVGNAKCEVLEAQKHVSLLQSEIEGVRELKRCINDNENPFDLSAVSTAEAISTAESLLLEIRHAFPSADTPERFRDKLRWALKDKLAVDALAAKLRETESSLQTILQLEQNRISRTMWSVLLRQSTSIDRIEKQQASNHEVIQTMIMNHRHPAGMTGMVQVDIESVNPEDDLECVQLSKPLPQLDRPGFSAQLVIHPQGRRNSMTLRMTAFSKIYTASFKVFWPSLSFCVALRSQNIVPMDSAIIQACTTGNFKQARHLLANGSAQVSDMSSDHWPILDYAIQGGSCRIVQLLLDHGADPNMTYDQSSMSPIQSAFMHGRLDMARHLISAGADIDHVDRDGFSALSYLWVVDQPLDNSADFVRMCSAAEFDAVNAVDSRGWAPLHRAAAIGTAGDIDEFVKLGASTGLRTQWYGWTPLFFAASHDNVATFTSLVQHSQIDIRDYLDGDGWNLLHCAVYFGAPKIMRLLVGGGIDINLPTKPAPMLEDPELAYLELTARDLAIYMGPERYKMYTDALSHSGYEAVVDSWDDVFWDAEEPCRDSSGASDVSTISSGSSVYGAEDVDDQWTILHWASYCGSEKVMRLLLMKGADPKYTAGITAYLPPSLDDVQQPQSPQYIHGSVARPFHGPSKALCEEG